MLDLNKVVPIDIPALPPIRVFTDGSSKRNGQVNAVAGIGIHFPDRQLADISVPYNGGQGKVTNQRAELEAIRMAIERVGSLSGYIPKQQEIHIYTDSEYSIKALTIWVYQWVDNNWMKARGQPVKNRDIIEPLFELMRYHRVRFFHVTSHTNKTDVRSVGNARADSLATQASAKQIKK